MELTEQKCVACEGGVTPFNKIEAEVLLKQVPGWELSSDGKTISKKYQWKDFVEALAFVNKVGALAQGEGHHPDIHIVDYKFVKLDLSTHAIGGLSQNDFILAAKIDQK
jgi:4a-hydroxytetrahydrobiopterin dehydratase